MQLSSCVQLRGDGGTPPACWPRALCREPCPTLSVSCCLLLSSPSTVHPVTQANDLGSFSRRPARRRASSSLESHPGRFPSGWVSAHVPPSQRGLPEDLSAHFLPIFSFLSNIYHLKLHINFPLLCLPRYKLNGSCERRFIRAKTIVGPPCVFFE